MDDNAGDEGGREHLLQAEDDAEPGYGDEETDIALHVGIAIGIKRQRPDRQDDRENKGEDVCPRQRLVRVFSGGNDMSRAPPANEANAADCRESDRDIE